MDLLYPLIVSSGHGNFIFVDALLVENRILQYCCGETGKYVYSHSLKKKYIFYARKIINFHQKNPILILNTRQTTAIIVEKEE